MVSQKILWSKQKSIIPKLLSLTSRKIKNQPDKMQIQSKNLPTKQSQIKTNQKSQIPKILLTHLLSLSLAFCLSLSQLLLSVSLSRLGDDSLQKYCLKLESFLKHDVFMILMM